MWIRGLVYTFSKVVCESIETLSRNTLQQTATNCNTEEIVYVSCDLDLLPRLHDLVRGLCVYCDAESQHAATRCNALQHRRRNVIWIRGLVSTVSEWVCVSVL